MKITFILTDFPAYSQTFIEQQVKNIINFDFDLEILANNKPPIKILQPIYRKYKLSKITHYYRDDIYSKDSNLGELKNLINLKSDIFHCHFLPTGVALTKIFSELSINKPIIISAYGIDVMTQNEKNKYSFLNKKNVFFLAISNSIKKKLIYLGIKPWRIWIIPLSIDFSIFKKIEKTKHRVTQFTSICRFVEKKGLNDSIQSFYLLKNKNPNLKFSYTIFGNGPEEENLKLLIKNLKLDKEIKIYQPISHNQILSTFKKTDFLIQTSKTASNGDAEGQTLVLQEAQACGIPVISTYHDGIPEGVINNKTGFLAEENNICQITKKISKAIYLDKKSYKKMSIAAAEFVRQKYDNEIISKRINSLYLQVLRDYDKLINTNEKEESLSTQINKSPKPARRILFFSHTAGLGGSERSLLELIKELQNIGVICHVVLPYEGPLSVELKKNAVDYIVIKYHWWCSSMALTNNEKVERINESISNLLKNKLSLDKWDADVIFTNTLTIPWGSLYAQLTKKPHVTFIREFGDLDFNFDFYYGYTQSLTYLKEHSDYVFTNSKATLKHISLYLSRKNLDYAYTYINIPKKVKSIKITNFYKKTNSLKLMITGGILPTKNQLEAVIAVNILLKKKYNVELALLGPIYDNQYFSEIQEYIAKQKISDQIHILNFKENPYPYMDKADIGLVCSRNESYGRVTLENMALKKPVIVSNSGANSEFVKHGYNGYLYSYGSAQQLVKYIEKFIKDKNKVSIMGRNAFKVYKKVIKKNNYGLKIYKQLKNIVKNKQNNTARFDNYLLNQFFDTYAAKVNEFEKMAKINNDLNQTNNDLNKTNNDLNKKIQEVESNYQQRLYKIYSSKTWKMLYFYKRLSSLLKKNLPKQNSKMF